jgi:hypothetical protein
MCGSVDREDFLEAPVSVSTAIVQIMNLAIEHGGGNWSFEVKMEMKLAAM